MLSVNQLRIHLYPVIDLMAKSGMRMNVVRQGIVYEMTLKPTNIKPKRVYKPRPSMKRLEKLNPHTLDFETCKQCGELVVEGICLNPKCPKRSLNYVNKLKNNTSEELSGS